MENTFISHLIELRNRLVRAVVAILVVALALMPWAGDIYDLIALPMMQTLPEGTNMIATGVVTPFFVPLKVTLLTAFLITLPYVLHQVWAFIAPGLYSHEKRIGLPLVLGTTVLFLLGMAFCYFFVFQTVFKFIYEFAPKSIMVAPDIAEYLSFVMTLFLAFGLTFEVPVAVILLAVAGVVTIEALKEARPYVIVGAFVIAAVITPPDVVSQFMLAVPMIVLYEVGIVLARILVRKREQKATAEEGYVPPSEADLDRELDNIEDGEKR